MWGEFWTTFGAVGLALLVTCTVLNLLAALVLARKSLPRSLEIELDRAKAECAEAVAVVRKIEAQVTTWRAELEGLIEESASQFERLERKRASAAAAASRAERGRGNGSDTTYPAAGTRDERIKWIREQARQKGLL
jgi:multidrug resistance efflux pump